MHPGGGRSVMHGVIEDLCRKPASSRAIRHEVAETSTLVTFVAAGLGVAVVPEPVGTLGVPGVAYRPLSPADAGVELAVALRAVTSGRTSPALSTCWARSSERPVRPLVWSGV